ncbi:hypothetical protein H257_11094 [Aphanomyces astaci]|uniref:Uncharacterized protein n=1 Tax=Aphanomyces astaci TaxID=112090 RepID=W4G534_APHAT|nr:hypothetical protein H257_11094 [Aphanomyces astaci]ETV74129.1 hypothetical protein H257_11094 [Aphanomyces astaci]|eukprot:XP_009836235.1 hypothetical protein H257_11094 [Aphanomyces astaci]
MRLRQKPYGKFASNRSSGSDLPLCAVDAKVLVSSRRPDSPAVPTPPPPDSPAARLHEPPSGPLPSPTPCVFATHCLKSAGGFAQIFAAIPLPPALSRPLPSPTPCAFATHCLKSAGGFAQIFAAIPLPPAPSRPLPSPTPGRHLHRRTSLSAAAATLRRPPSSMFSTLHHPPPSPQIAACQCNDDKGVLYNTPPSTIFAPLHHPPPHIRRGKAVECSKDGGRRSDAAWTYGKGSAATMKYGHHCTRRQRAVGHSDGGRHRSIAQQVLQTFSRLDELKRFIFSA